jgi:PAS domain S-box-containing protein
LDTTRTRQNGGSALAEGRDLRSLSAYALASGPPVPLEGVPAAAFVHDGERILDANTALAAFLGREARRVAGLRLEELTAPEDLRSLIASIGATQAEPPPEAHVQRFRSADGRVALGNVLARRFGTGGQVLVLIEPQVVSERSFGLLKLLEEAVDRLDEIVFITEADAIDDVGRRIVFVNRAYTRITGFEPEEVVGKTPNVTIGAETDPETLARIAKGIAARETVHEELHKYGKGGVEYWVELDIIPVFDEAGRHTNWVSIQRDITVRKQLEEQLVETAQIASAGLLAANLASEINNPLAAVSCSLEWLSDRLPMLVERVAALDPSLRRETAEILEAMGDARAASARMAAVTNYLRLLGGTPASVHVPTSVADVLDAAIVELAQEVPVPGRIEREYLPVSKVSADPNRLRHAFRLALRNAAQALLHEQEAHNRIVVRVRPEDTAVVVEVEDTGRGIPPEMQGKLFTPFVTTKAYGLGNGLGLFVAQRLVREIGGEIDIRPGAAVGTLVKIRVPASTPAEAPVPSERADDNAVWSEETGSGVTRSMRGRRASQ